MNPLRQAKLYLFIPAFCASLLFAACGVKNDQRKLGHADIELIQKKFEDKQVQVLLASFKNVDEDKLEQYRSRLKGIGDSVANEWQVEPNKLVIDSYIKFAGLKEEYRAYSYQGGEIQASEVIPQHIIDSFNKHFVCYPPGYWEQFNIEQAVGFTWDTLDSQMIIRVTKVK